MNFIILLIFFNFFLNHGLKTLKKYYRYIFFKKIRNIKPKYNVIWDSQPKLLTCCIIEPRLIEELRGVLNNMARVYGNKDVGLIIFHGIDNENYIKEVTKSWENVKLKNLNVKNLLVNKYSELLSSLDFYNNFNSKYVLIFQTDTFIFKEISNNYFKYDYVGARWKTKHGNQCGNGGFSLRNIKAMKNTIKKIKYNGENEDLYFSKNNSLKICSDKEKDLFSSEPYLNLDSIGCHQPFCYIGNTKPLVYKFNILLILNYFKNIWILNKILIGFIFININKFIKLHVFLNKIK